MRVRNGLPHWRVDPAGCLARRVPGTSSFLDRAATSRATATRRTRRARRRVTAWALAFAVKERARHELAGGALGYGLSRLAAAGGRLLQPDDAQAERREAGGIRALSLLCGIGGPVRAGAIVPPLPST